MDLKHTDIIEALNKTKEETGKYQYAKVARAFGTIAQVVENIHRGQSSHITSTSNLYDEKGNLKLSWVKTNYKNDELMKNWQEYFETLVNEKVKPIAKIKAPNINEEERFAFYPLPDLHLGMLVCGEETNHGINYDLKKAEEWINESIDNFLANTPKTHTAIVCDLGDLLHAGDDSNRTKSGHWLDTDTRHFKIFEMTTRTFTNLIERLLTHHEKVIFYSVAGNHSEAAPIYLKTFLSGYFKNNPRVEIIMSNKAQQYYVRGKVILGFTHGHQLKPDRASQVLVFDNKDSFSQSEYRYFHFGHWHQNKIIQNPLCDIEVHKNLPPRDAWAEAMGFRGSIGEMKAIIYDENKGEVFRYTSKITNK